MALFHRPLLTQQKQIPFVGLILINLTWFIGMYTMFVSTTALPLTLRRFTDDTGLIALITSIGPIFGIVLGPAVNYISDRIWTRFGRRRPFLFVATCSSLMAMATIPFLPSLTPLILMVGATAIIGDVGSTAEPLWLEIVPPSQRGRAFAIRMIMINCASLYFFQIMFAQFDMTYQVPLPWVGPEGWTMTGEQGCYLVAAGLQAVLGFLYAFVIREVKPEGVTLGRLRDLEFNPFKFIWRLIVDVFGERRWWWLYLFYVAPVFAGAGWGGFVNLMLVEQFQFDKPAIAQNGLPAILIGTFLVTPFMGWYADKLPKYSLLNLAGISGMGMLGCYYAAKPWIDLPGSALPPLWAMVLQALAIHVAIMPLIFSIFQIAQRFTPGRYQRFWAWYLGMFFGLGVAIGALYLFRIAPQAAGTSPTITTWFLYQILGGAVGCLGIVAGPLLYDYIPRDKIGTLSSGFGMISTALSAVLLNFAGQWLKFFTTKDAEGVAHIDYSSCYYLQVTLTVLSLLLMSVFAVHVLRGRMVEYGRLGLTSSEAGPAPTKD